MRWSDPVRKRTGEAYLVTRIVGNPETDRLPAAGSISEWPVIEWLAQHEARRRLARQRIPFFEQFNRPFEPAFNRREAGCSSPTAAAVMVQDHH